MQGRRVVMILLLAITLAVSGCTASQGGVPDDQAPSLVLGESVLYPESEPPFIRVKNIDDWVEISSVDAYPSAPAISPDGQRLVYIAPFEFEMAGEVYLYETGGLEATVLLDRTAFPSEQTPYQLLWLNERKLVVLSGYQFGTIPSRRLLLEADVLTGSVRKITELPEGQDIREMEYDAGGNRLRITAAVYNGDFTDAELHEQFVNL